MEALRELMFCVEKHTDKKNFELDLLKEYHAECMDVEESNSIIQAKISNRRELNEYYIMMRDQMAAKIVDDAEIKKKYVAAIARLTEIIV